MGCRRLPCILSRNDSVTSRMRDFCLISLYASRLMIRMVFRLVKLIFHCSPELLKGVSNRESFAPFAAPAAVVMHISIGGGDAVCEGE